MAAGSVIVDLLMRTASFETDTKRAAKSLKDLEKEAEKTARAFKASFAGNLLSDLTQEIGKAVGKLPFQFAGMIKGTIDANDHLNDLAQKAGIAADTLGGIGFAAGQAGLDLDSVAAGVGKLNKSLAEASAGNKKALEAFNALGVSVKDAAGNTKTADAALAELADKFASYADGPEKAALALRIFGKAGADMIPLLNGGGAALLQQIAYFKRYSGVTVEGAKAADDFNDTLGKIKLLGGAFAQTLTAELLPALQHLANLWLENKENGDQFKGTATGLADTIKALATFAAYGAEQFVLYGRALGAVGAAASALARGSLTGAREAFGALLDDAAAARARLAALNGAFSATAGGAGGGRGFVNPSSVVPSRSAAPGLPSGNRGAKEKISDAERYIQALQKQLEKTQELSAVEQLLADISHKRLTGLTRPLAGKALDLAQQIDAQKQQNEYLKAQAKFQADLREERIKSTEEAYKEAKGLEEDNEKFREQTELIGATREAELAIRKARLSSTIAIKEEQLAIEELNASGGLMVGALKKQIEALKERKDLLDQRKAMEDFSDHMKKIAEEARAMQEAVKQPFEDAFASFLDGSKTAGEAFKSFANSVIADLARIQARKLAMAVFGDENGQGGVDWGSVISSVIGAFGGGKATGGPVDSNKAYMVGERGPELFVPGSNGNIVPNDKLRGGKTTINHISVAMPQGANRETGHQFGAAIAQRLATSDRRNN